MTIDKKKLQNIFKGLTYKIFKIIYGEIKDKITFNETKDVSFKKIEIDKNFYEIYYCKDSSLYTDTIHNTAILKNNKIIEGPSFQLRDNVNVDCMENSVLLNGTPRFRKIIKGNILSLLTGGGGNSNYWHWMFDVLPRFKIFEQNKKNLDFYLFPDLKKKFQIETLNMLGIPSKKRISSKSFRHFYANEIIITSHPYTILNDPTLDSLKIPLWIIRFLKLSFLNKSIESSKMKTFPKKIYINRKDASSPRYIINKIEVENTLKKFGFENLTMSDYSFGDQVALFNNAKEVVGLHGAGFANIIFCKPGTKIIEMRTNSAGDIIKNLAENNNLNYFDISAKPKTIDFNNQAGDIEIDLGRLKNKLS